MVSEPINSHILMPLKFGWGKKKKKGLSSVVYDAKKAKTKQAKKPQT